MQQWAIRTGEESGSLRLDPLWKGADVCAGVIPAAHGHGGMEKEQYRRIGEVLLGAWC